MLNKVYKVVRITDRIVFDKSGGVHDLINGNAIRFTAPIEIGTRAWFEVMDNLSVISTSPVVDYSMQGESLTTLITNNTIYYLKEVV